MKAQELLDGAVKNGWHKHKDIAIDRAQLYRRDTLVSLHQEMEGGRSVSTVSIEEVVLDMGFWHAIDRFLPTAGGLNRLVLGLFSAVVEGKRIVDYLESL